MMPVVADIVARYGPLVPLAWTAPAAVLVFGFLVMYWRHLKPRDVPRSRRRLCRANTMVQFTLTLMLVYALSIADGDRDPGRFNAAWIGVIGLILLTIAFAIADSLNTMRLHRRTRCHLRREARPHFGQPSQNESGDEHDRDAASAGRHE